MLTALVVIPVASTTPAPPAPPAGLHLDVAFDQAQALAFARSTAHDLLVVGAFSPEEQVALVTRFQSRRRSRLVPVIYLSPPHSLGLIVPPTFRPGLDDLLRGEIGSPHVLKRMLQLASAPRSDLHAVTPGAFELDQANRSLRVDDRDVFLTRREAEILALLLACPNRTVAAGRLAGAEAEAEANASSQLQVVRRHISNIRRKLGPTSARRCVRTVRGAGYRFEAGSG